MFGSMFRNLPNVTKNILIINLLFFLATFMLRSRGLELEILLSMHYPASPWFYPHQIITAAFMHGSITHIFMNMFGLVFVGSHLERLWGPKRFLIFYVVAALTGTLVSTAFNAYEVYQIAGSLWPEASYIFDYSLGSDGSTYWSYQVTETGGLTDGQLIKLSKAYAASELGASGALMGVLMAFAMLFPNTEFRLLFPPIPIKAKWLALILGVGSFYAGISGAIPGIGHWAHLGGMLGGYIMIKIWQKDTNTFY